MLRPEDYKSLLYLENTGPAADVPVIDDLTRKMTAAFRASQESHWFFCGFHTCDCGADSMANDYLLGGLMLNSLCFARSPWTTKPLTADRMDRRTIIDREILFNQVAQSVRPVADAVSLLAGALARPARDPATAVAVLRAASDAQVGDAPAGADAADLDRHFVDVRADVPPPPTCSSATCGDGQLCIEGL
jgi:hypothetical protein